MSVGTHATRRRIVLALLLAGVAGCDDDSPATPMPAMAPAPEIPPPPMPSVEVEIHATDSGVSLGSVLIEDTADGARFTPDLTRLTPGEHGFHVHANPDCGMSGQNAGGHYDPANTGRHEGPNGNGHLGDLPRLAVDAGGAATAAVVAPRVRVSDILGRALMVHGGGDNYSDMPAPLGGGGARVACAVIPDTAT